MLSPIYPNNDVPGSASPSWPVLLFALGVSVLTKVGKAVADRTNRSCARMGYVLYVTWSVSPRDNG